MSRVIVTAFTSLDGVTQDPSGTEGTARGGWLFTFGPELIAGDKFQVGEVLDTGTLLLGRRTWEQFAKLWPNRDDPFSVKMNAASKLVASQTPHDVSGWQNSALTRGGGDDGAARAAHLPPGSLSFAARAAARLPARDVFIGVVSTHWSYVVAGRGERGASRDDRSGFTGVPGFRWGS